MQKVIDRYSDATFVDTYRNRYTRWKFGKPKHNYYVRNRRSDEKILDLYDKYLIENVVPGQTIAFDCAGYYLDEFIDNLTVVDLDSIVLSWFPSAKIYTNEDAVRDLYNTADNFIVNNTIRLRWKTFEEHANFWKESRKFLKDGCNIFFSYRDIFIFHNRLKYNFSDLLSDWLKDMEQYGFYVKQYTYDPIDVTADMTELERIPEIKDMINGNVKIHWEYRCK